MGDMPMDRVRWYEATPGPQPNQVRLLYGNFPAQPAEVAVVEVTDESIRIDLRARSLSGAIRASLRWRCALLTLPFALEGRRIKGAKTTDPPYPPIDIDEMECHEVPIIVKP